MSILQYLPATAQQLQQRTGRGRGSIEWQLNKYAKLGKIWRIERLPIKGTGQPAYVWEVTPHQDRRHSGLRRKRLANLLAHAELAERNNERGYARKAMQVYRRFAVLQNKSTPLWNLW